RQRELREAPVLPPGAQQPAEVGGGSAGVVGRVHGVLRDASWERPQAANRAFYSRPEAAPAAGGGSFGAGRRTFHYPRRNWFDDLGRLAWQPWPSTGERHETRIPRAGHRR